MDLAQYIPQEPETVKAIYEWHESQNQEFPRTYLGASTIGCECERYLWYTFRWACKPHFDGRMYRLFMTGHLEEPRMIEELQGIGVEVHPFDPETGEQFGVSAIGGHFKGHMDGCGLGILEAPKTWHVLEFKTHNDKSFNALVKDGVEKSKPQHFAQMTVYMGLTGMKRAFYLAKNKNDDHLHQERIRYDATTFKRYMNKAERIISANEPPPRISDRPDFWKCQFCDAYNVCWGIVDEAAVPIPWKTCRTCCHATPETDADGRWSCARLNLNFTPHEQRKACECHLLLPSLISFAEPVDATDDSIEFKNEDETVWHHGGLDDKGWSTEELIGSRGPLDEQKYPGEFRPIEGLRIVEQFEGAETVYAGDLNSTQFNNIINDIAGDSVPDRIENNEEYTACQYGDYLVLVTTDQSYAEIRKGVQ